MCVEGGSVDRLLSVQEVADRLGVSFWTVYRMARSGQLASVRIGRRRLFAMEDLEELIRVTRREGFVPERSPESDLNG